ncbi:MAG: hypothetical protein IJR82_04990 [Bacilli bacterium]|nr:hypothetical protein [Bacilli bacterium]
MIDMSASGQARNRFDALDGIEYRIIHYLLSLNNKTEAEKAQVDIIRKLLCYDTSDALNKYTPSADTVSNLIWTGEENISTDVIGRYGIETGVTIDGARIFFTPRLEDSELLKGTLLKIYIDSIIPENTMISTVNIGIDIIVNNNVINVTVPDVFSEEELNNYKNSIETFTFSKEELINILGSDIELSEILGNDLDEEIELKGYEFYNIIMKNLLLKTSNYKNLLEENDKHEYIIKPSTKLKQIYASLGASGNYIGLQNIQDNEENDDSQNIYIKSDKTSVSLIKGQNCLFYNQLYKNDLSNLNDINPKILDAEFTYNFFDEYGKNIDVMEEDGSIISKDEDDRAFKMKILDNGFMITCLNTNSKIITVNVSTNYQGRKYSLDYTLYLNKVMPKVSLQVRQKSRVSLLVKAILSLLNGADVQGVGKIEFSRQKSIFNQAQYGIWNHRACEGMKIVMGVKMSGVS